MTKFYGGILVVTKKVRSLIDSEKINRLDIYELYNKHLSGDWGLAEHKVSDKNDKIVRCELMEPIISIYKLNSYDICIVTAYDRYSTTICLKEEIINKGGNL